jgi:hypothetical protein
MTTLLGEPAVTSHVEPLSQTELVIGRAPLLNAKAQRIAKAQRQSNGLRFRSLRLKERGRFVT